MKSEKNNIKKVLIFDFDGTIAESSDMIIASIAEFIPGFTKDRYVEAMRKYYENNPLKRFLILASYEIKLLLKRGQIQESISNKILGTEPSRGMKDVLKNLREKNIEMYIISSNFRNNIHEFLNKFDMNYFEDVFGDGSVLHKAKTIQRIKSAHSSGSEIYYIGDELRDIDAARKSGVKEVGVTWGINSRKDFEEFGTKIILDSPAELLKLT